MNIVQIRASIFYPQTIGFTPENVAKYKDMFLPNGTVASASPFPEMAFGNLPLGLPWQLVGQDSDNNNVTVAFLPNKIDIIKNIENLNEQTETVFVQFCSEKFRVFLEDIKMKATRLAYCPLLSMAENDSEGRLVTWKHVISQTAIEGIPCQDINMSFLIKKNKPIEQQNVDVNFLFKMMDGMKIKDGVKTSDSVLIQLDINTVPEGAYTFDSQEIKAFLEEAVVWKQEFVDSVLS